MFAEKQKLVEDLEAYGPSGSHPEPASAEAAPEAAPEAQPEPEAAPAEA